METRGFRENDVRRYLPISALSIIDSLSEQATSDQHDRTVDDCQQIEYMRFFLVQQSFKDIEQRSENRIKTQRVLLSIWSGETGFGLFLRNFDLSSMSARVVADNGSDAKISAAFLARTEKIEQAISRAAEPTPLIKIHNLEDFDYVIPALELGDDWLNAVQSLVRKAAFIVFIFRGETPGVSRELELLRELRREASTILLLEKEPGSVPMDFPTQFRIGADAGLPDEAATLIARYARDTKPLRFEDPPPSPKRSRLTGDVRRLYTATCDIFLLRARLAFAAVFTGNLKKIYEGLDFAACSFAGAFMLEDEGRMAQAVCEMGYWLLYTPYIRMMGGCGLLSRIRCREAATNSPPVAVGGTGIVYRSPQRPGHRRTVDSRHRSCGSFRIGAVRSIKRPA